MFRHVALFRIAPDTSDAQREAAIAALRALPAQIPELVDYRVGLDAGLSDDTSDLVVVADFAEPAHYRLYADHPAHRDVVTNVIRPIITERVVAQYPC